ncbi:hypothetical protein PN4B1_16510 [Paenibacillus naphthalenovorans]|uniref:DctM-like transporter n=1 Tax=Paenibacillus naphthalenovorans TaxID=162209 RepID=A0A0U2L0S9_9BACL|nr:DctM-like transporter [Paenibacillus naphthalenovorans]GCL71746.1 hypothetical protein PN4B1_16510 [Paenibacillus naphthalenovorans]
MTATVKALWALVLPAIIIDGLKFGIFTPTEAGVVAAFYALFVGLVVYRELKLKNLFHVLVASGKMTSIVMFLAAAAMVSSWLITVANIPGELTAMLGPLMENKLLLLMAINLVVFLVGTAMDLTSTVLILTPVLMPIITAARLTF